jgi:excisionase family DNA binding protein
MTPRQLPDLHSLPATALLSPAEASLYLACSMRSIYKWANTHPPRLVADRAGSLLRFRREALDEFLRGGKETCAQTAKAR